MSDFTKDDVTAATTALEAAWSPTPESSARYILAAVAPAIAARALRAAADVLSQTGPLARIVAGNERITITTAAAWLRSRAKGVES